MARHLIAVLAAFAAMSGDAADMSVVTPNDEGVRGADDSASIQNAVDMAAKRGTGKVVIPAWNARTGKPGWTISRTVLLPGDMTVVIDNARLALADDVYANFFRSANTWTKKGATPEGVLRNIRIIGSTLRSRTPDYKASLLSLLERDVWPKVAAGLIPPSIYRVLPITEAEEARALMQSGKHNGKIVLTVRE